MKQGGQELDQEKLERRDFLSRLGGALACGAAAAVAAAIPPEATAEAGPAAAPPPAPGIPNYDWSKHHWAFGVDATRCIGCLRCVEACKKENNVSPDPHHFRTWVERYVYLEGEEEPHVDSQADPVNIEASGAPDRYRFANRYKGEEVRQAFFVPKLCNHCTHPACVQVCPTGATFKTEDGAVLIDHTYCIGCQYCVQACPYGARSFDQRRNVILLHNSGGNHNGQQRAVLSGRDQQRGQRIQQCRSLDGQCRRRSSRDYDPTVQQDRNCRTDGHIHHFSDGHLADDVPVEEKRDGNQRCNVILLYNSGGNHNGQ